MEMEAVRDEPFREDVLACLPATPWSISDEEISRRRDLRATRCRTPAKRTLCHSIEIYTRLAFLHPLHRSIVAHALP